MAVNRGIKKKKGKKNFPERVVKILLLITCLWFIARGAVGMIKDSMIDTAIIQKETIEEVYQTKAYIFRDEVAINSPASGKVEKVIPQGSKVRLGSPIFYVDATEGTSMENQTKRAVNSTMSGIVYYQLDGLESVFTEGNIANLDMKNLDSIKQKAIDNRNNDWAEQGVNYCKVVNNLGDTYIYLEYKLSEFEEPLKKGDTMKVRFKELDLEVKGRIHELYGSGDNAKIILKLFDHYEQLMTVRSQEVEVVMSRESVILIDKHAVVSDEEKGAGVYALQKGQVKFQPIKIIGETDKQYKIEGVEINTEIVTTPKLVKVGDYIY